MARSENARSRVSAKRDSSRIIKAFAQVEEGVTLSEQEVLRHCAQRLEDFMVPRVVEFVRTAPTTESGKLHRRRMASQDDHAQFHTPA